MADWQNDNNMNTIHTRKFLMFLPDAAHLSLLIKLAAQEILGQGGLFAPLTIQFDINSFKSGGIETSNPFPQLEI